MGRRSLCFLPDLLLAAPQVVHHMRVVTLPEFPQP